MQKRIYEKIIESRAVRSCLTAYSNGSKHLVCISILKKLCNHPVIVYQSAKAFQEGTSFSDEHLEVNALKCSICVCYGFQGHFNQILLPLQGLFTIPVKSGQLIFSLFSFPSYPSTLSFLSLLSLLSCCSSTCGTKVISHSRLLPLLSLSSCPSPLVPLLLSPCPSCPPAHRFAVPKSYHIASSFPSCPSPLVPLSLLSLLSLLPCCSSTCGTKVISHSLLLEPLPLPLTQCQRSLLTSRPFSSPSGVFLVPASISSFSGPPRSSCDKRGRNTASASYNYPCYVLKFQECPLFNKFPSLR